MTSTDTGRTPRPFLLYVGLVSLSAILLVTMMAASTTPFSRWALLGLLLAVVVVSENFAADVARYNIGLSYPLVLATVVLLGPIPAAAVAAVSGISVHDIRVGRPASTIIFNVSQLVAVTTTGAMVYEALGGRQMTHGALTVPWAARSFGEALVPLLALAFVCATMNVILISFAIVLKYRESLFTALRSASTLLPAQMPLAFVGFLMAQVLAVDAVAFPLFVLPLLVAREMYQRYSRLSEVYSDTLRSLVRALEMKDPYTRGHSERVAEYAGRLGTEMALGVEERERLSQAALLHDLGKLTIPREVLNKPSALSAQERKAMTTHPVRGAAMVARIPHLNSLSPAVAQHHERVDGSGYPDGRRGEQIPLFARILAVADSYDAMTSERAYRPAMTHEDALRQLIDGAGSEFDVDVVAAFMRLGVEVGVVGADSCGNQGVGIIQPSEVTA